MNIALLYDILAQTWAELQIETKSKKILFRKNN